MRTSRRLLRWLMTSVALLALGMIAVPVGAQTPCDGSPERLDEIQSRHQLKRFVQCAVAHIGDVGWKRAVTDFNTSLDWLDGSMYLFASDEQGVIQFIAGTKTEPGTNLILLRDSTGHLMVQDMKRIIDRFGGGFAYYRFVNPNSGKEEPKVSYVVPVEVDGKTLYLGAGAYPLAAPGACSPDHVRASLVFTESDVERFVNCAEHSIRRHGLGALRAFEMDPRWVSGPTYLFLVDGSSVSIAHGGNPDLVGTDFSDLTDPDGFRIVPEMRRILADFGEGYVYYHFTNPATGKDEPKVAFVKRVSLDGHDYILGAGLYVASPQCRSVPAARDVDTRSELERYVNCARELLEERGELAFDLFLHHRHWIDGSTYIYVMGQDCRHIVYPLDYRPDEADPCAVEDAQGVKVKVALLETAADKAGDHWLTYQWLNPKTGKVQPRSAYVRQARLGGETVAIGAGLYLDK